MLAINAPLYAIASKFASKSEYRPYLNGVRVEPCRTGGALLVATDGHRLLCLRDPNAVCTQATTVPVVPALVRTAVNNRTARTVLVVDAGAVTIYSGPKLTPAELADGIAAVSCPCTPDPDAFFPDWRRTLPTHDTPEGPLCANPDYIASFCTAAAALTKYAGRQPVDTYTIRFVPGDDGLGPVRVLFASADAFGVLMPKRYSGSPGAGTPDWVN